MTHREARAEILHVAALLLRSDAIPSDFESDWPAQVSGRVVARKMEDAHKRLKQMALWLISAEGTLRRLDEEVADGDT